MFSLKGWNMLRLVFGRFHTGRYHSPVSLFLLGACTGGQKEEPISKVKIGGFVRRMFLRNRTPWHRDNAEVSGQLVRVNMTSEQPLRTSRQPSLVTPSPLIFCKLQIPLFLNIADLYCLILINFRLFNFLDYLLKIKEYFKSIFRKISYIIISCDMVHYRCPRFNPSLTQVLKLKF